MASILLLVGLGNPGAEYARHRHNVGFRVVDAIADAHRFGPARAKFQGEIREGYLDGPTGRQKAIALKPLTYMNESGQSVGEAARFYKIGLSDIVVFHDELDLPAGKIRVKTGGGAAGHNGLKSLDVHLGPEYRRVRVGIGHPGDRTQVTGHVLGDFAKADAAWLDPLLAAVAEAAPLLSSDDAAFAGAVAGRTRQDAAPAPAQPTQPAPTADRAAADKKPAGNPFAQALARFLPRKK